MLIAGTPAHVDEVAAVLRREPWLGYDVVGALTPAADLSEETSTGIPVLGNTDEATSIARHAGVDVIFFAGGSLGSGTQMRKVVWDLEHQDVQVVVAPSVTDISGERIRVRPVGGLPLMHIDPPTATDASRWGKRLFDVVGSLCAAPPVRAPAPRDQPAGSRRTTAARSSSGRPGSVGTAREFGCFKFRTMVTDAEDLLARLHAEQGYEAGLFKMKDDPRITKPGQVAAPLLPRRAAAADQRRSSAT